MPLDLTALFQTLHTRLVDSAQRIVGSHADAEDVVQEAFLVLLRAPDRAIQLPNAFLSGTVRHIALDRLRSRREELPLLFEPMAPPPTTGRSRVTARVRRIAAKAAGNRQRRRMWAIWKGLADGRQYSEIALDTGMTVDGIKALLRRSRRRLHAALETERQGGTS